MKQTPSTSNTRWQVAFLIGVTTSFLAACFVLGLSIFTTVVAVLILLGSFVNKLLARKDSIATENFLISNLKQILNVGLYLKTLTLVAWISTIGLIGYGLYGLYASKQIISIDGFVETYEGKPADDAFVTLILTSGKKTVVTKQGKFAFTDIDLRKESSKRSTLEVSWNNKVTSVPVDLKAEQPKPLVIKLPADDAPFRVSYYSVGGPAIDLLVRGQLDERWEEVLGGQPFIFPTKPFSELRALVKNYREKPYDGEYFYPDPDQRDESELETDISHKQRYFVGSRSDVAFGLPTNDLRPIVEEKTAWNIIVNDSKASDRITFWKLANVQEIEQFTNSTWLDFYEHIANNSSSADCCIIYTEVVGCGDLRFNLEVRIISLRVIVLENTSAAPLNLENLTVRQNNSGQLRLRDHDQTFLVTNAPEEKLAFPLKILKPNEKLLVPLELVFAFDKSFLEGLVASDSEKTRKDLITKAEAGQSLNVTLGGSAIEIQPAKLLEMMRTDQRPLLNSEYVFGPSITIGSVRINGTEYGVRNYDKKSFVIRSSFDTGSCPYVYTYSTERSSWMREGRILYGKDTKDEESTDQIRLKRFDGRIVIKEIDPEVSYIDSVYIKAILNDGRELRLYPKNRKLRFDDGDYLTLKMGQETRVDFDNPYGYELRECFLVARGYYIPTESEPSLRPSQLKSGR